MKRFFWPLLLVNIAFYLVAIALWVILDQLIILKIIFSVISFMISTVLMWLKRDSLIRYARGERFAYQINSFVRGVSLFGILALINFLIVKHPQVYDLSKYGISSLSSQTLEIVKRMDAPIEAMVFATKLQQAPVIALLELYRYVKPDINIRVINIDLRPDLVRKFSIIKDGTIVFKYNGRVEKIEKLTELEIDNALIRLKREKRPLICWSSGHQEIDLYKKDKNGASYLYSLISQSAFDLKIINLQVDNLHNCDVLVILGPKSLFRDQEVSKVKDFFIRHGKILLGLGPSLNQSAFSNLRQLFKEYGVILENNFVVDRLSYMSGSNGLIPLIKKLDKKSSITANLSGQLFFPLVSSISYHRTGRLGKVCSLARSSDFPASWAENSLSEMLSKKISFNEGVDLRGPVTVALSWKSFSKELVSKRFVVLGNGSFIQNRYKGFSDNFVFFTHALIWLAGDDQLTSFVNISLDHSKIVLSKPLMQVLFFFSLILLPLILGTLSIWIYLFRKRG